ARDDRQEESEDSACGTQRRVCADGADEGPSKVCDEVRRRSAGFLAAWRRWPRADASPEGVIVSPARRRVLLGLIFPVLLGCSPKRVAINMIGNALAGSGGVFTSDDDPELVRDAVPFGLK